MNGRSRRTHREKNGGRSRSTKEGLWRSSKSPSCSSSSSHGARRSREGFISLSISSLLLGFVFHFRRSLRFLILVFVSLLLNPSSSSIVFLFIALKYHRSFVILMSILWNFECCLLLGKRFCLTMISVEILLFRYLVVYGAGCLNIDSNFHFLCWVILLLFLQTCPLLLRVFTKVRRILMLASCFYEFCFVYLQSWKGIKYPNTSVFHRFSPADISIGMKWCALMSRLLFFCLRHRDDR